VPDPDVEEKRKRILLEGDLPSPANPPKGCHFNTRCHLAKGICFEVCPEFAEIEPGHTVACHHVDKSNRNLIQDVASPVVERLES
jgi:oligopeptide/dipeptide ABC transporter ATP-binding protein